MLEVLNGRTLAQKFRIGDDLNLGVLAQLAQNTLDLVAGADRNGRFGDDDRLRGQERRKLAHCFVHVAQIGMAVATARRRADRDEDRLGILHPRHVGRELKPSLLHVGLDQRIKTGLEDRDLATVERLDLLGILVDADHLVTEVGKASPGYQSDISGADHSHAHSVSCSSLRFRLSMIFSENRFPLFRIMLRIRLRMILAGSCFRSDPARPPEWKRFRQVLLAPLPCAASAAASAGRTARR